ncbi:MAG: formylglycine-generating enzyme family protein [Sphaerochaetaceae bacterium]|nr:formylglycine-generating enzyme family protein [Sphaerochaetaceae bacterium]
MFKKKITLPEVEEVKLPKLFGMRPGKYILILLILVILVLTFLIGFLPGIINGGRYVHFESPYSDVGVIVDDIYVGSTEGSRFFLSSGNHKIEYIKSGDVVLSEELEIDHPIFLTLLFKRTLEKDVAISQDTKIYEKALSLALEDLPLYSAVTDYPSAFNYRPVLTNLAKDAVSAGVKDVSKDLLLEALFITTEKMYEDYKSAKTIYSDNNIKYESNKLDKLDKALEKLFNGENPEFDGEILIPNLAPVITADGFKYQATEFTIGNQENALFDSIAQFPVSVKLDTFTLSEMLVSEYEYALFIKANPYWAKDNIDTIVKDGMADEYYLAGIFPTTNIKNDKPIRNISYYAAKAYAEWMKSETGKNYRLPTEAELELASYLSTEEFSSSLLYSDYTQGPKSLNGGLWELTSTAFLPLSRVADCYDLSNLEIGDVVVKGGSFISDPNSVDSYTVGALDRKDTSEYLGFRLALGE